MRNRKPSTRAADAARPVAAEEAERRFSRLRDHRRIALAVSGGSDSTALMWLATRWASASTTYSLRRPKGGEDGREAAGWGASASPREDPFHGEAPPGAFHAPPSPRVPRGGERAHVSVLTVDHGLRPESADEGRRVVEWAAALGLDAHVLLWEGAKPQTGIQAAAREARYRLMAEWCMAHGASVLVVAHTLEDQAETFVMRLARGSGVAGLSGIPEYGAELGQTPVAVARPLISIGRQRLRATLEAAGHPWIEDPSNEDPRFERVRIRKAMPQLKALGLHPEFIGVSVRRIAQADEALEILSGRFLSEASRYHELGYAEIDLALLAEAPNELRVRALKRLLSRHGGGSPAQLTEIEALAGWCLAQEGRARTLGGCRIAKRAHHLLIGREPGRIDRRPLALPPGGQVLWDRRFEVRLAGTRERLAIIPAGMIENLTRRTDLPAFVQAGLPAIVEGSALVAIPSLGLIPSDLMVEAKLSGNFQACSSVNARGVLGNG